MFGAVDIGGTKTEIAIFDSEGNLTKRHRFPTSHDYQQFKMDLAEAIDKITTKNIQFAAVAAPGQVNRAAGIGITYANLPWINTPLQDDVSKLLKCPVVIENDAKLAGLAEAHKLDVEKYPRVLYVTVSTGIGGGYIVNHRIDKSLRDNEIGHMLLEHEGKLQRWEDFASGKAIYKHFGKKAKDITSKEDWYVIAHNIAIGLIDVIAIVTPDIVVMGGSIGNYFDEFKDKLIEDLKIYQNNMLTIPPVVKASHPDDAVVYGCYYFAKEHYDRQTS